MIKILHKKKKKKRRILKIDFTNNNTIGSKNQYFKQ